MTVKERGALLEDLAHYRRIAASRARSVEHWKAAAAAWTSAAETDRARGCSEGEQFARNLAGRCHTEMEIQYEIRAVILETIRELEGDLTS